MSEARDRFAAFMRSAAPVELDRAALEIARIAYPGLDPGPSLRQLDALAAAVRAHVDGAAAAADAVPVIAAQLFGPLGFHGNRDDYYDPRNSFLNDVLERRTGIPITLAVVVIEVARRLDVAVDGVGFPGHFLVRATGPHGPQFFDPFFAGRQITEAAMLERLRDLSGGRNGAAARLTRVPPDLLSPASTSDVLVRMLRNLLRIYLDRAEPLLALEVVERILVLLPDAVEEVRMRAQLFERLECFAAARDDYRRYLTLAPRAADAGEVRARLARLAHAASTLH